MQLRRRVAISFVLVCISLIALAGAPRPVTTAAEGVRDLAMATPESVGISSDRLKRLDAAMKKMIDSGKIAGAVTMLTRHGKTVNVTVNGKKDIRKPDPIDKDSIFRIYSMTKPVTGVAMMMLYEEGLWRLDDPVSRYVPEFAKLQLGMKDTGFYVPKEKVSRLALVHGEDATGKLTPPDDRGDPTLPPAGASGGGGLFSTAADYARFCEMLLGGGQFGKARLLAPRTVEMMRTNHVLPEPLKTMRAGTGWGMDFSVMLDAATAGEPVSNGTYWWWGIAGSWFWIDPVEDLAFIGMIQHQTPTFRTVSELHGVSRQWVYQAVMN